MYVFFLGEEKLNIRPKSEKVQTANNFWKTIGHVLAAATAIGGLYFGLMQLNDQRQNASALLINSQIDKGFDQLGGTNSVDLITHIGGIYVLQDIMNRSPEYHRPIVEALSAFVIIQTRYLKFLDFLNYAPPEIDVQAALTVLGNRTPGGGYIDLHGAKIPWCNLNGLDFKQSYLNSTNLDHAWLQQTNFQGATMTNVSLRNAKLQGANLTDADLTNADLRGADLRDLPSGQQTIVSQAQLDRACGDAHTYLPLHFQALKTCP